MTQSTCNHVAIIMDGNGRWATQRGLPRTAGHREGAKAVRRTVEAAAEREIGILTLYAFSSDNWRRPQPEVDTLMRLFGLYLEAEADRCVQNGIRFRMIGRRDRLARPLLAAVEALEQRTARLSGMRLRVAIDYSSRDSIVRAASKLAGTEPSRESFAALIAAAIHDPQPVEPVDLLIRTAGEHRLSDFLLWECAYAELVFTPRLWPDFQAADLDAALDEFHNRERRFGGLVAAGGLRA